MVEKALKKRATAKTDFRIMDSLSIRLNKASKLDQRAPESDNRSTRNVHEDGTHSSIKQFIT